MGTTTIPEERRYLGKDKLKTVLTKVKEKLADKVDKVSGKQLSTNDYTTTEKNKLAGIAAGANNYSHPAYTARTGVPTADAKPGFGGTFQVSQPVSDLQGHITAVNTRNITIPNAAATTSAAGLMSSTDKTKLAGIEAGAQKNTVTGIKGNAESSYRTGNVNLTPANIGAAAASHTHTIANVTNLQSTLDGKAAASHKHAISDVNNLQTSLDGKAAKSHTHSASEITDLNIPTYETLTLTVTAEDGSSVAGQKATINGEVYPLDSTGVVVAKIPFGVEYTVILDKKQNYEIPNVEIIKAALPSRELHIVYSAIKLGVFIQDKIGNIYTTEEWSTANNSNANAIAILTDELKFIVSLKAFTSMISVCDNPNRQYSGVDSWTDGEQNTANMLKAFSSAGYAASMCAGYVFPDGSNGFLPAINQLKILGLNISAVQEALAKCGGDNIIDDYHWSSTINSYPSGFTTYNPVNAAGGYWGGNNKLYARAFGTYKKYNYDKNND